MLCTVTDMPPGQHGQSLEQRARCRLVDEVGEDEDERPLGAAYLREGACVVALDRAWLEVEEAVGERCRPAPARCEACPDPVVEGDRTRPVAELVGRRRDRQHRV